LVSQNNIISCSRTGYRGNKTKEIISIFSAIHTEKKDSVRLKEGVGDAKMAFSAPAGVILQATLRLSAAKNGD
jgi:hypothetical protein